MNSLFEEAYRTFGLDLKSPKPKGSLETIEIPREDGAAEFATSEGGIVSLAYNTYQIPTSEVELIKTYRSLALTSDVDRTLNEIRNEVFVFGDSYKKAIDIEFTEVNEFGFSKALIKKVNAEYNTIYNILDFENKGLDLFNKWYIDGRLFLHKIVDKNNAKEGIKKVVPIDSLKIKKVVEYPKPNNQGVYDLSQIKTYYIFSDVCDVFSSNKTSRLMVINFDAIAYADSGIYDMNTGAPLSYLWKMIVPYNNMRMMEEALLVYRVVRSPERRAFYISVGNLSKPKAEAYIKELMNKFKNKMVYDAKTGTIVDRKNIMSMVEDYWLPRRDDGKSTEIQPLPGATNLGTIDDVELFKKKFLESSNVPTGRFKDDTLAFSFGRSTEISRDEYRFKKFLDRIRKRFSLVLEDLLKTQLILKNIIVEKDWENLKKCFNWVFVEDNNFVQWKESEVLNSRLESLTAADQLVGKYFTREWALKNIMKMGEDDIIDLLEKTDEEKEKISPPEQPTAEEGVAGSAQPSEEESEPEESIPEEEPS